MAANRKKMLSSIALLAIGTFLFFSAQGCKPDLIVEISGPSSVNAGSSPDTVTVEVKNDGNAKAQGTISTGGEENSDGYMVDIVLSSDNYLPVQYAVVSDTFEEDMLLVGGRISRTQDLAPGESKTYTLSAPALLIPADTPHGEYCLGAVVDPGKKVKESNEGNNTVCHTISIIQEEPEVTIVLIVRHAERANDALTADGERRAETLARILSESGASVVLSTNTIRTRETVNNYADPRSIQIDIYNTVEEVTNIIKSQHIGKVVLVAGHSDTTPQIIEGLGVSSAPSIGNEFNNLFIITICTDGVASLTRLKYEIHHNLY
jgi:phosphohistidine phosphatase SixA